MTGNETSDVAGGKAPPEQAAEEDVRSISRRTLLTSFFALSIGAAAVLDPDPAQAQFGIFERLFGGFRYRRGGHRRYAGARVTRRRRGRVAQRGGGGRGGAGSGGGGGGGSAGSGNGGGGLGKADY